MAVKAVVFDIGEALVDETRVWSLTADRVWSLVGHLPANDAGMPSVFIRRGPCGVLHAEWPEAGRAGLRIDSLSELPEALHGL